MDCPFSFSSSFPLVYTAGLAQGVDSLPFSSFYPLVHIAGLAQQRRIQRGAMGAISPPPPFAMNKGVALPYFCM